MLGLDRVKTFLANGANKRWCDAFFWFMAGYASHVIADGACHPFVMDKVGRYEGPNKAEHRALEMGLDVLLMRYLTQGRGHAVEVSYARMDSDIASFNKRQASPMVLNHFANLIEEVYGPRYEPAEIAGWVVGMSRLGVLAGMVPQP